MFLKGKKRSEKAYTSKNLFQVTLSILDHTFENDFCMRSEFVYRSHVKGSSLDKSILSTGLVS